MFRERTLVRTNILSTNRHTLFHVQDLCKTSAVYACSIHDSSLWQERPETVISIKPNLKLEALVPSGRGQRRISRVSCHGTFQGIMPWHITWYHVRAHHGVSCHATSWVLCHTTSGGIMPHHIAGIMPQQIARYHALAHCGVLCHGILQGTCSYTNVWQILDLG